MPRLERSDSSSSMFNLPIRSINIDSLNSAKEELTKDLKQTGSASIDENKYPDEDFNSFIEALVRVIRAEGFSINFEIKLSFSAHSNSGIKRCKFTMLHKY